MSLSRTYCVSLLGVQGHIVEVEVHLGGGDPGVTLVGLPDATLREARDRIRAAVANSSESWPSGQITISLSPASLPKSGSLFDLAIAGAVLAAAGEVPADRLSDAVLLAELGLDGRARPVRGVLPAMASAADQGFKRFVVATGNAAEARLVPDVEVTAVADLAPYPGVKRQSVRVLLNGRPAADIPLNDARHRYRIPLPAGAGDDGYTHVFEEIVLPVASAFAPQLILVSAGYDAHAGDPLGGMRLTASGFRRLTAMVRTSQLVPIAAVLEGGYDLTHLGKSVVATLGALLGAAVPAGADA